MASIVANCLEEGSSWWPVVVTGELKLGFSVLSMPKFYWNFATRPVSLRFLSSFSCHLISYFRPFSKSAIFKLDVIYSFLTQFLLELTFLEKHLFTFGVLTNFEKIWILTQRQKSGKSPCVKVECKHYNLFFFVGLPIFKKD